MIRALFLRYVNALILLWIVSVGCVVTGPSQRPEKRSFTSQSQIPGRITEVKFLNRVFLLSGNHTFFPAQSMPFPFNQVFGVARLTEHNVLVVERGMIIGPPFEEVKAERENDSTLITHVFKGTYRNSTLSARVTIPLETASGRKSNDAAEVRIRGTMSYSHYSTTFGNEFLESNEVSIHGLKVNVTQRTTDSSDGLRVEGFGSDEWPGKEKKAEAQMDASGLFSGGNQKSFRVEIFLDASYFDGPMFGLHSANVIEGGYRLINIETNAVIHEDVVSARAVGRGAALTAVTLARENSVVAFLDAVITSLASKQQQSVGKS